jgi:hypothetical protein
MVLSRLIPLHRAPRRARLFAIVSCVENDIELNTLPVWEYDYAREQVVTPKKAAWTVPDVTIEIMQRRALATGLEPHQIAAAMTFIRLGESQKAREETLERIRTVRPWYKGANDDT